MRGESRDEGEAIRRLLECKALRLLVRLAPNRPSSNRAASAARRLAIGLENPLTMGEYDRRELVGENDETWSSITDSSVALVRAIMFARNTGGSGCVAPWILKTLQSEITVWGVTY